MRATAAILGMLREVIPDLRWRRAVDGRREIVSGLAGALLVIPQAITFAYLAGVPPEFGLYCAVFVGLLASLLGNSPMVGGPNTSVSILIAATVMPFSGRGSPLYLEFVFVLSLAVGVVQLAIWLLRGAHLFRYFSPAAITGIKTGVGILLISSALEGTLGLAPLSTQFFYEKFDVALTAWDSTVNPYAVVTSAVTIGCGLALRRRWCRSYIMLAVLAGGVMGCGLYFAYGPVTTQLELLGHVTLRAWPFQVPRVTPQHWLFLEQVIPSIFAIAVLGLAQSLVIARDLKARIAPDIDLHKEVFAQGVANMASPFFSTFAGSGSFNRTAVAVEMGARTPLSGIVAAFAVVLLAWVLGPLLTYLPMPAVAGVLALVGMGMIRRREIRPLFQSFGDAAVFSVTTFSVAFLDLSTGILVAVVASVVFFMVRASDVKLTISVEGEQERIAVTGNLYYASVDGLAKHLRTDPTRDSVLDLSRVPYCDPFAVSVMEAIRAERERAGGRLEWAAG